MDEIKQMIFAMNANMDKKFENMEKKFEELKIDIIGIKQSNEEALKRIEKVETETIKRNIIIFGMDEVENNLGELKDMLVTVFGRMIKNFSENDIDFVYRLGKKSEKARPIKMGFVNWWKKAEILRNRKELKGTKIYVEEEISKEMLEENKKLIPKMKEERQKGNKAIIRNGKLIVEDRQRKEVFVNKNEEQVEIVKEINQKKRNLSEEGKNAVSQTAQKAKEAEKRNVCSGVRKNSLEFFWKTSNLNVEKSPLINADTQQACTSFRPRTNSYSA